MPDHPQSVMLFAAGFGTRMKELTRDQPKPMIPVAGRPLVDHALDLVGEAGIRNVVANLHYKPENLRTHLESRGVTCVLEMPEILETGGGLRNALPQLGAGPVYTLNTDAVWRGPNPLHLLRDAWDPETMDALLVGISPQHAAAHSGDGDFSVASDGRLRRGPGLIYGGAQIIRTEQLAEIEEAAFSLNLLWDQMIDNKRLFGLPYPGQWCDVGHPAGIPVAEALLGRTDV